MEGISKGKDKTLYAAHLSRSLYNAFYMAYVILLLMHMIFQRANKKAQETLCPY